MCLKSIVTFCHPPVTLCHPQTGCKRFVAGHSVTLTPLFIKKLYIYPLACVGHNLFYNAKVIIFHCTDKLFQLYGSNDDAEGVFAHYAVVSGAKGQQTTGLPLPIIRYDRVVTPEGQKS